MNQKVRVPPKLIPVFTGPARYRGAYGGRGSGKTRTFALMAAIRGMMFAKAGRSGVILCGREFMNSLDDSSMAEVKMAISDYPWLAREYEVGEKFIRTRDARVHFLFAGLRHNLDSIKSKARILIAWSDESDNVSETAWRKLIPTVREPGSEIWVTWNPEREGSATDKRFIQSPPENAKIVEINHSDNPWFPAELESERLDDLSRLDDAAYDHIWNGNYLKNSDAQVLSKKYEINDFKPGPDWNGPYHGLDYGFANDPMAAVKCWEHEGALYIEREAGGVGIEIDDTAAFLKKRIPGIERHIIRADNARPELTSQLKRNGLPKIRSVKKWPGSVEDGITRLRSYRMIYIHPRCKQTIREARLYSYKVDRLTGDVLPILIDDNNHYMDAIRYAIQPRIKTSSKPRVVQL